MENYKIIFSNIGYAKAFDGSARKYLLHCHRYLHPTKRLTKKTLTAIHAMLRREQPDVFLCVETNPELTLDIAKHFPFHHAAVKYGPESICRKLPILRKNSNSLYAKEPVSCRTHFLSIGMKRLLYEITLPHDITLFVGHFSLSKSRRRKQWQELAQLIGAKKRVIVCGDFNCATGVKELAPLLKTAHLTIANTATKTFPTSRPAKNIDLFLCSPDIRVIQCDTIAATYSDHLPVRLVVAVNKD